MPPDIRVDPVPGQEYKLKIIGTFGTNVSLLGVDQSVYLLSERNLLAPESVSWVSPTAGSDPGFCPGRAARHTKSAQGGKQPSESKKESNIFC